MKKYLGLTEAQFYGREKIGGWLDLSSLTSIPTGFNPTVGGDLDLRSLTSIPIGFNPTVGGWLDLSSLTSIPTGFNPTVGGDLDLSSLTSIPTGFNPTVGGSLYLRSLTFIPTGFNPTVGGSLDLSSLTSIPNGFNPTVGGWLGLRSLTSIPNGFNPTVGGSLYLHSGIKNPGTRSPGPVISWQNGKYILVDGILSEVLSPHGNSYKVRVVGQNKTLFILTDGTRFAHGATLAEARDSLVYKISDRDTSKYKGMSMDTVLTFAEAVSCYRAITGACEAGTRGFVERVGRKEKYTIAEMIKITEGQYGHEAFKGFFS